MTATLDIDALFRLPLAEFTAARNALAQQLKKAGNGDQASQVAALPKPPVAAWTVNQLYWNHRKAFDQLIAAGERLRQVQASQLAGRGGDMRGALEARRAALRELTRRATSILRDGGHAATPDTLRRVSTTLDALATYGNHGSAPAGGRLTHEVDPPGFEALAALTSRKRSGGGVREPTRVIPFRPPAARRAGRTKRDAAEEQRRLKEERAAKVAAAAAALRNAERTLREAQKTAARAEAALKKAAARAKEAEKRKEALAKPYEKAVADADEARQDARRVASKAEDAAQAVTDAERAVAEARGARAELS
jgi:hypothetical protein